MVNKVAEYVMMAVYRVLYILLLLVFFVLIVLAIPLWPVVWVVSGKDSFEVVFELLDPPKDFIQDKIY